MARSNVEIFCQKGYTPNDLARDVLSNRNIEHSMMLIKYKNDTFAIGDSGMTVRDMAFLREMLSIKITNLMNEE